MGRKLMAVIGVLALAVGIASAQRGGPPGSRDDKRNGSGPPMQGPRFASPGPHGPMFRGPGPHMGDWLRRNENLPPEEQQRKLEQSPDFQRLPPERQQRLRERLRKFNSLPPEQKDRILANMERFEHLPPDQQQRLHEMFHQFRALPPERKQELRRAFRQLEGLSPEDRQKTLESPEYRNNYSQQERDLLRGMSTIGITPSANRPPQTPSPPR